MMRAWRVAISLLAVGSPLGAWMAVDAAGGAPLTPQVDVAVVDTPIRYSSPAFADLNGDGYDEIVVGTTGGQLLALEVRDGGFPTAPILWETDLGSSLGSSPAIGDVDGDGDLEIAIGVGYNPLDEPGRIVLVSHTGQDLWSVTTLDRNCGPDGIPDGVFGTPVLADINGDGYLEVIVTGFDEELYVIDHNGNGLPGWPKYLRDNTWGSPVVADLNDDGVLEIVVGTYFHEEPCQDHSCGRLFVFDPAGNDLPGWPKVLPFHVDSSPAVGDIDGDGSLEIVVGTGRVNDPVLMDRARHVYAFEADGRNVQGWPVSVAGYVFGSPALSDVDDDGDLEIFVGDSEGYLYAWHHDGTLLPGWPVTPLNQNGNPQELSSSPIVGDFDGDHQSEVMIPVGWDIVGFNVNGTPMSYRLSTQYSIAGTPAIGDPDHDGELEATIGGSRISDPAHGALYFWELSQSLDGAEMAWPVWRRSTVRDAYHPRPAALEVSPGLFFVMREPGDSTVMRKTLIISNGGDGVLNWSAEAALPVVSLDVVSGTVGLTAQAVTVEIDGGGYVTGTYSLGEITITGTAGSGPAKDSPVTIPITLYVGPIQRLFVPLIYH